MAGQSIVSALLIGLIAGWLASVVLGGGGILRYVILGVLGSFVGTFLVSYFHLPIGIANTFVRDIVISTIGAIVLVLVARIIA